MKIAFILVLSLLLTSSPINAQEGWYLQNSPTTEHLNSVFFIDSLNGWTVGENDVILHTTNGGSDWEYQGNNHPSLNRLHDVYFTTNLKGTIVGWSHPKIISTTNGGEDWYYQYNLNATPQYKIHFSDSSNGWSVGYGSDHHLVCYYILHTIDGGETWHNLFDDYNYSLRSIFFISEVVGWSVGYYEYNNEGVIARTTDGGNTWDIERLGSIGIAPLYDVFLLDQNSGWIAGQSGIYFTTDGGITWDNQLTLYTVFDIIFTDPNNGWAVGYNHNSYVDRILNTSDGGRTWGYQQSGTTERINSVFFIDSVRGWAVGHNGTILHTRDGGGITRVKEIDEIPVNYLLSNNYPNPFNPLTTIKYHIPEISFVTLKVYDVLGKEIAALVNEEKPAGSYEVEFDGDGLTSGIYFYQLRAGEYVETKKMVLLK